MKSSILLFFIFSFSFHSFGQEENKNQLPEIEDERATEDYSYLKDKTDLDGQERLKYISLGNNSNSYLTIGASYRARVEHLKNDSWTTEDENYYSQRLTLHTDWNLGKHIRFFGELYHGFKTGEEEIPQSDDLALHQGFLELKNSSTDYNLSFRLGRQEKKFGSGRLVDLRVGPNIRRSFDLVEATFQKDKVSIQAFYGKEVQVDFEVFDNEFTFFDEDATNPKLWGVYSQFPFLQSDEVDDKTELYYIGFQSDFSAFNDVMGEETRHSIGIRRFGTIKKKLTFNTEFIYQFGEVGNTNVSAFNLETEWKYMFLDKKWKPIIGLKLDWSSGDKEAGDDKLQSFNPMFVNPAIYSLAAINTPVNLLSFHPSWTIFPTKKIMINMEFALFYRSSEEDGFYSPPRFQTRPANGISDKHIGNVIGLFLSYEHNRYVSFDLRTSYFMSGNFIEKSGDSNNIFQFAPTAVFIF